METLRLCINSRVINTDSDYEDECVKIEWMKNAQHFKIIVTPKEKLCYEEASLTIPHPYKTKDQVFLNGYQSWTDSREAYVSEYDKGLQRVPAFLDKKYAFSAYGDYRFYEYPKQKGILHGWNYTYFIDDDLIELWGSMNENMCFTSFTHDSIRNEIVLRKDIKGFVSNEKIVLFDIMIMKGSKIETIHEYFEAQGIKKKDIPVCKGYTSWYNYYQDINEKKMLDALKEIEDSPITYDVFQIDDGFETFVGDFMDVDPTKFPNGLGEIVNEIHAHQMQAGIWIAPFIVETRSKVYREHKEWLAKDEKGNYIKAGHNWSHSWVLDFYNDEVREYIRQTLEFYKGLGFDFFKLDFLYAIGLIHRSDKTRAMIEREGMEFLRSCLEKKTILGCGVPLVSACELVDYCRVGCDVGEDYDNNWLMRRFHRERVSTKNTLLNTIYRYPLNQYYFGNDPDVYLLRDTIKLLREQQITVLTINSMFGRLLFTSDNVSSYTAEDQIFVKECLQTEYKTLTYTREENVIHIHAEDMKNESKDFDLLINDGIISH